MWWARSYWWVDQYFGHISAKWLFVQSYEGEILLGFPTPSKWFEIPKELDWWSGQSILMMEHHVNYVSHDSYADYASLFTKLFRPFRTEPHIGVVVPSWFLLMAAQRLNHRAIVTSRAAGLPLVGLAHSPRSHQ
jgi:hypothetical protein